MGTMKSDREGFVREVDKIIRAELKRQEERERRGIIEKPASLNNETAKIKQIKRKKHLVKNISISFLAPSCFRELSLLDVKCGIRQLKNYLDSTKNLDAYRRIGPIESLLRLPKINEAFGAEKNFYIQRIALNLSIEQLKELYNIGIKICSPSFDEDFNEDIENENVIFLKIKNYPDIPVEINDEYILDKILTMLEKLDKALAISENSATESIIFGIELNSFLRTLDDYTKGKGTYGCLASAR